ncbi:MAG: tetratricopeptide repeat protein [Gemmatimonadaceae bacterium]
MTAVGVTRGRSQRVLVGSLLLLSTGCVATRNDVRILQGDIAALRTELLRDDAEHRDALAQAIKLVTVANDSLARISMRTVGTQGDVRGEMRSVRDQLQQLQQLVVQLQGSINRTRADFEERTNAVLNVAAGVPPAGAAVAGNAGGLPVAPAAATVPNATPLAVPATTPSANPTTVPPAAGGDAAGSRGPGPLQLYNSGLDQLKRGSTATARTLFQELLATAPANEHAPDAQFYIAESLFREKNLAGADAAYAAVVAKFPQSPRAATAHYKRAQIAVQQGNLADARKLLTEVIARFPASSEAVLAADQLKQLH